MIKKTILLWGIATDSPLARVRAALEQLAAPVIFLDQQRILETKMELTLNGTANGTLQVGRDKIALESINSVYARPYDARRMAAVERAGPESLEWKRALFCEHLVTCWTELTPALVVNRLSAMGSNGSKPYQAALIKSQGFEVPDTLVTTDRAAATAFCEKHGSVIFKSISGVRSHVSRLGPEHCKRLGDLSNCPTQFQEHIDGTDVRIHVVGNEVFGCEIESTADDYRYARASDATLRIRACTVSPALADMCRGLAKSLNLAVAGIDLRRKRNDGCWCCFEVNPSPGFTFYEEATGQPIGEAIAKLLVTG